MSAYQSIYYTNDLRQRCAEYTENLRIILCANSTSRIIGPIRSRCLLLRVGAPKEDEICRVISHVARKEGITVPEHVQSMLAQVSGGNLRRALLSMEALYTQDSSFATIQKGSKPNLDTIPRPDWEKYCSKVAERILRDQTPEALLEVRAMLYELLVHCLPATLIISVRVVLQP